MIDRNALVEKIKSSTARSAWQRGVREYAVEIVEVLDDDAFEDLTEKRLLRGAADWKQYSYGGNALIMDENIARRLCNPSQLKYVDYGRKQWGKNRDWLDVQAIALQNAASIVLKCARTIQPTEKTSFFGGD